jgi:hypothetical protein
MLSAETQDFNIPTSAFAFVLERPVTPVRKTFSPAPASPNNLTHRRNRSRGRSLDGRTKKTNPGLSPNSSPPATKKSQPEHSLRLDHDQEGTKAQDVELNVESNVFPGGIVTNAMKVMDDCRELGIQDVKPPHVSNSSNLYTKTSTEYCLADSRRRPLQWKIKFTRKLNWSTSAYHNGPRSQISNRIQDGQRYLQI